MPRTFRANATPASPTSVNVRLLQLVGNLVDVVVEHLICNAQMPHTTVHLAL